MYIYFFTAFVTLSLISCQIQQSKTSDKIIDDKANLVSTSKPELVSIPTPEIPTPEEELADKKELVESFTDNSKIGIPRKNKIEISHFEETNKNFVEIKFYSLSKDKKWNLKQTFEFEKYGGMPIEPKLEDFNNDGLKDITYNSSVAARGANELRKLLIYDKVKNKLIPIENSDDYPNLEYNDELDCLDSWMFSGSTATVFLKIDGNKLREFASVVDGETRRIYTIDKNGKEKLLKEEKINKQDGIVRYKNFNPLKSY